MIETQRLEAARMRRDDELDRRHLQEQVRRKLEVWRQKKEFARNTAMKYMQFLKRDKMEELQDQGLLRSQQGFQMGADLLPKLQKQVLLDDEFSDRANDEINNVLDTII